MSPLRSVVAAARTLIMSDAHKTRVRWASPCRLNPAAVRAALDGIAADAARFRRRRGAGDERAGAHWQANQKTRRAARS